MRTGFTEGELFRKYLWYLLRERRFDADAVADLLHLRATLGLADEQVPPLTPATEGLLPVPSQMRRCCALPESSPPWFIGYRGDTPTPLYAYVVSTFTGRTF